MTKDQVIDQLRSACEAAGSQRAFADKHGIDDPSVSRVLRGMEPTKNILAALGLKARLVYEPVNGKPRKA